MGIGRIRTAVREAYDHVPKHMRDHFVVHAILSLGLIADGVHWLIMMLRHWAR